MNPSPAITFEVDLTLVKSENIGPVTSQKSIGIKSANQADNATAPNRVSTWLPSSLGSSNVNLKHGETFTLYGLEAIKFRNLYAEGYAPEERTWVTVSS